MVRSNVHSIDNLRAEIVQMRSETRKKAMDPSNDYNSLSLMRDTTSAVSDAVSKVYRHHAMELFGSPFVQGFAIYVYGSPARTEMTTYSDLDLHVIIDGSTPKKSLLKTRILDSFGTFAFAKVDDPNWEKLSIIEQYAAKSITEGNQVIDARYVGGDMNLARRFEYIQQKYDTLDRSIRNIFFQWFYLDHYYSRRNSLDTINVKYSRGGFRELLTYDWFDKTMSLFNVRWPQQIVEKPFIEQALQNFSTHGLVDCDYAKSLRSSVDFIILLRNEMLHVNEGTQDRGITHLNRKTGEALWETERDYFRAHGAAQPSDISTTFNLHRMRVRETKELLWSHFLDKETERRGQRWFDLLQRLLTPGTAASERREIAHTNDHLLQIASVWSAHYASDYETFSFLEKAAQGTSQWELLASLACSPLCSQNALDEIARCCIKETGLGYILRIIGRNPSVSRGTLERIVKETSLDKHYRIVAQLHLEKGLEYATTRAS